jgi:hypothetical protein
MTTLTRPVRRKVQTHTGTPLVVTLTEHGVVLREPRRRQGFMLPYGTAFLEAARLHVNAERRRKQTERAARRRP